MHGISRQTDYASRIVLHLAALGPDAPVQQIRDIAERRLMPIAYLRRVVAQLAAAGILHTTRGNGGGVSLGRPADQISLLDIVQVVEGGIVLNGCVGLERSCPLAAGCPVQDAWAGATEALERHLARITFADLATTQEKIVSVNGYAKTRPARRRVRAGVDQED